MSSEGDWDAESIHFWKKLTGKSFRLKKFQNFITIS